MIKLTLTLPFPPSVNKAYRSVVIRGRAMVLLSAEARRYKKAVAILAASQMKKPLEGEVAMTIHLYRPRKVGDATNYTKTLDDTLEGICYLNDSQITEYHIYRHDDKANPRVEVTVSCQKNTPVFLTEDPQKLEPPLAQAPDPQEQSKVLIGGHSWIPPLSPQWPVNHPH